MLARYVLMHAYNGTLGWGLLSEAKKFAQETGRTLAAVIALREALSRRRAAPKRQKVRLPVFKGDGLREGVDLEDWRRPLD